MNVEKLHELLELAFDADVEVNASRLFDKYLTTLQSLQNNPADPGTQTLVAETGEKLRNALYELQGYFSPADLRLLEELGGLPYVTPAAFDRISAVRSQGELTPAVAAQECASVVTERKHFFESLTKVINGFTELGIEYKAIPEGEAEIGFRIPRDIFNNQLKPFADELRQIDFIIRAFAESEGFAGESAQLRQLSTTDPLVMIALATPVIAGVAKAVSWGLDQWKKVEEIKNIRAQTEGLKIDNRQKVQFLDQYDKMIDTELDSSIKKEAKRLVGAAKPAADRRAELENHLKMALERLLALLERGMTVELRLGPPPESGEEPNAVKVADQAKIEAYNSLEQIQGQLTFRAPQGPPVMKLPDNSEPET